MNLFGLGFLSWDNLGIIVIVVIVFIVFLKDFKLTSKSSWVVLLGLTAIGGLSVFQTWRRKQLLKDLEKREGDLSRIKAEYDRLMEEKKITKAQYDYAKGSVEKAEEKTARDLIDGDKELAEKKKQIAAELSQNMSTEESVRIWKDVLRTP